MLVLEVRCRQGWTQVLGCAEVAEEPDANATKLFLQLSVLKITFLVKILISSEMQPAWKIDLHMLVLY